MAISDGWSYVEFFFKERNRVMLPILDMPGSSIKYFKTDKWAEVLLPTDPDFPEPTIRLYDFVDLPVSDAYKEGLQRLGFQPFSKLFLSGNQEFTLPEKKTLRALVAHCISEGVSFFAVANDNVSTAAFVGGYDADARRMYVGNGLKELLLN